MSISLEQVSKHYDGTPVLSDVSVTIDDAELFVLLGPSGSGKSTLLRAIAGLTTIDHGRIVLHGRDVTHQSAREREVGFVFQNYALFPHMSVADNIEFALRARRVPAHARRKRRLELLRLVALEGFGERLPGELSGGQQQRVAVARALAHEPRVLLLDEPFGALDAKTRDELRRAIREIQRQVGITTVLVTHDQEEAFTMADRIGVMDRGRLQDADSPRMLYSQPRTRFVATFLGAANLLLGRHETDGVRLGASVFEVPRWPQTARIGAEATVVVRPEDLTVVPAGAVSPLQRIGSGTVVGIEYAGSIERIRVAVESGEALASAVRPAAPELMLDVVRSARDGEGVPLALGDPVAVGASRVHVLPTPIGSLRLIGADDGELERLAASPLIRDLASRMHIVPTCCDRRTDDPSKAARGLPVVPLGGTPLLGAVLDVLGRGAQQVLAIGSPERRVEQLLMFLQGGRAASDGALAAAGTLLRHLAVEATMLVPADEGPARGPHYRALLDLRNAALRVHGVDVRTEVFHGDLSAPLGPRLAAGEGALVLIGLESLASGRALLGQLAALFAKHPPVAVLIVCGPDSAERAQSAAESPPAIAATRRG